MQHSSVKANKEKNHGKVKQAQTGFSIIHDRIGGRLRIKVPKLYRNNHIKQQLEQQLQQLGEINRADANALTGTILIIYRAELALETLLAKLTPLLGKADVAPVKESGINLAGEANKITSLIAHRKKQSSQNNAGDSPTPDNGTAWHTCSAQQSVDELKSSALFGLSQEEAAARLKLYGPNALPALTKRSQLAMLGEQIFTIPVGLLGASAVISVATGGIADALVILGVVAVNTAIGYFTEMQSERTISALTKHAPGMARVQRDGLACEVATNEVVAGDLLLLAPGSYVAADARLLQSHNLSVDESALTGESMPVNKQAGFTGSDKTPLAERANMVYMGTLVTGGSAHGVTVATAARTELGRIQTMVGEAVAPETPLQQQLDKMGTHLALLSGAVCAGVFGIGLARGLGLMEMLKASISLAVAAVPEGLPAVATTTLAMGIQEMRKRKVAIRQLPAVETLGSVQVLCLDKTGTLTRNRMTVVRMQSSAQRIELRDGGFHLDNETAIEPLQRQELQRMLQVVCLCSEARPNHDSGNGRNFDGSATEAALLEAATLAGLDIDELRRQRPILKTQYRAEGRPYMATYHALDDGRQLLAVKGSPDAILSRCSHYMHDGERIALDENQRQTLLQQNEAMAAESLRVLAIAYAEMEQQPQHISELTWLGLMGMTDPIRDGMPQLMKTFHRAGIRTVMITGDQSSTAYAIGRQLDLSDGAPLEILDSSSLDKLEPELLAALVKKVHVFARVSPAHKLEIVQALQKSGQVVAMTGDGINDGPALKAADIGVAMGKDGSEVARSVADVVLQDDNLNTMVTAVAQGRSIYTNIRKTIHYLLATNFTEIEVMLAGIALGFGSPLNPMQLLWINLISDIFPGLALSLEPPEADVMQQPPRQRDEQIIRKADLKRMGVESAVITLGTLGSYGYARARYGAGAQANTVAFTTLATAQLLHSLVCRSHETSLFAPGGRPTNPYLNLALGGSLGAQLLAATAPGLRRLLGTTPLGPVDIAVTAAGALLPLLVNELGKGIGKKQVVFDTTQARQTDAAATIVGGDHHAQ